MQRIITFVLRAIDERTEYESRPGDHVADRAFTNLTAHRLSRSFVK
jgi:hypothetical protein